MAEIKELIYNNVVSYNLDIAFLNERKVKFEQVLVLYEPFGLPAITNEELERFFHDTQELIIDKMISADPTIYPARFKRERAKEWLVMPEGFEALVEAINLLKKPNGNLYADNMNLPFFISDYELIDGVLEIKESVRALHEERHKVYATTQKQVDVNAQLVIIANAMNAIKAAGGHFDSYQDAHSNFIEKAIKNNGDGAATQFSVRVDYVSSLA